MILSHRHDIYKCGVFTSVGIGVSRSAREHWQRLFGNDPRMQGSKREINEVIARDYAAAGDNVVTRFKLRSGEKAEIRKSQSFYYVAAIRPNGQHDIIVIQPTYKEVPEKIRQRRLSPEWLSGG